jgi:hypothetical protein
MRHWTAVVFLAGALCGALMLGGGVVVLERTGQDAQAQSAETWQTKSFDAPYWNEGFVSPDPDRNFDDWLHTLPASCDVETIDGSSGILVYYRCPAS